MVNIKTVSARYAIRYLSENFCIGQTRDGIGFLAAFGKINDDFGNEYWCYISENSSLERKPTYQELLAELLTELNRG